MTIRTSSATPLLLLTLLTLTGGATAAAQTACERAGDDTLDYLLGEWRLVDAQGNESGSRVVREAAGGCALIEELRDAGGRESNGFLYRDPASGIWHGSWVDADGGVLRLSGEAAGDRAVLVGEATTALGAALGRMTLEREAQNRFSMLIELSTDGGATWSELFDGSYVAAGSAPAPTAPTREPTPETPRVRRDRATSGAEPRAVSPDQPTPAPPVTETEARDTVRPIPAPKPDPPRPPIEQSAREEDRPAPAPSTVEVLSEQAAGPAQDPIRMASPMRLQLPIGPVENLPAGYGWSSTDTALYETEGISIPRVTVKQRRRGGGTELEATVGLRGGSMFERVDLGVELLTPDGTVVASEELSSLSVGRGIPEQSAEGAVSVPVRLRLDRDTFDALFASSERPQLRMTVTVRE
ncbi:MAG TPA: hypothetical protein VMT85_15440 [Thermoanaerobaculia bacterium]|nr:hypothetical protein [Thermoanaerobaculia bacterium]